MFILIGTVHWIKENILEKNLGTQPEAVLRIQSKTFDLTGQIQPWKINILVLSLVQFSSRWYLCTQKSPYAFHPFSLKVSLWNGSNVHLIDNGPHPSFQGRSSSTSSFNASLLQVISVMMSLALCPQEVSQASQHQSFWEASHLWGLLCLPVYLHGHFPSLQHVQGSTPTGVSEGGCWPLTYSSLGFPFHFSLFVASSLNLRIMACVGWLSPLEAIQQRAWVTASTSIIKLDV